MKKLLIILTAILLSASMAWGQGLIPIAKKKAGGGGGAYYYGSGLSSGDYTNTYYYAATDLSWGDDVAISATGNITKIGVYTNTSVNVECRLYRSDDSLIGCYQFAATAGAFSDSGAVSIAVSNETIKVLCGCQSSCTVYYAGSTGGYYDAGLFTYGDACSGSFTTHDDYQHGVRLWVE